MRVLIVSFSRFSSDPRIIREIEYFKQRGWEIHTMGDAPSHYAELPHTNTDSGKQSRTRLNRILKLVNMHESSYWNHPKIRYCKRNFPEDSYNLIVANDINTLPLVLKHKRQATVLFDAHEYFPKEYEDNFKWRLFDQRFNTYLCKKYISKADAFITVCQGISDAYFQLAGMRAGVVCNAPRFHNLSANPSQNEMFRMIYHGGAAATRGVDQVIDLMDLLDERFSLDMILIPGDPVYIELIKKKAAGNNRIRFLDPVPTNEIPSFCNQYDIGLYPLKPGNFNNLNALPNKFFEFLQARIPPAIFPQPEMKRICDEFQCGIVSSDFTIESLASSLRSLERMRLNKLKNACNAAACAYSAERNWAVLDKILKTTVSRTICR